MTTGSSENAGAAASPWWRRRVHEDRRPALLASAGLVVLAVCYIGVNLLGIGLHSYGWFFGSEA